MTKASVFVAGDHPASGIQYLDCEPGREGPPAVAAIPASSGEPSRWVQVDRHRRRVEVDGKWLPLYYLVEATGPFPPSSTVPSL